MKTCSRCKKEKEISEFNRHKGYKDGIRSVCRACEHQYYLDNFKRRQEYERKKYKQNRESILARNKKYRNENLEKVRAHDRKRWRHKYLKGKYAMSVLEYDSMVESQNGLCAICSRPPDGKSLVVDHCYKSTKVRALLCHYCNTRIEALENPEWLSLANAYIQKHK